MFTLLPLASLWGILLFLAGIALLTATLMRRAYRQTGRRSRKYNEKPIELQPRPSNTWDGTCDDPAARLAREKVELEDHRREAVGQIDAKALVLRELIAQSERQITRLEELIAAAERIED